MTLKKQPSSTSPTNSKSNNKTLPSKKTSSASMSSSFPKNSVKHSSNDASMMIEEADHRIKGDTSSLCNNSSSKSKKSLKSTQSPLLSHQLDTLCPICDDDCTCGEMATENAPLKRNTASAQTYSHPLTPPNRRFTEKGNNNLLIINSQNELQKRKVSGKGNNNTKGSSQRKRKGENDNKKERLSFSEELVDKCAQYVISEYYFSSSEVDYGSFSSEDEDDLQYASDAETQQFIYLSEDESDFSKTDLNLSDGEYSQLSSSSTSICSDLEDALAMKVDSVIGPAAWNFFGGGSFGESYTSDDADDEDLFYFDDDGTDCLIELPIPTPPPESSNNSSAGGCSGRNNQSHTWSDQMAILTPQVLAAISAAAKTLNSGHSRRHLEYIRAQAEGRDGTFVSGVTVKPTGLSESSASFDKSPTNENDHVQSVDSQNPLKRWSRIPICAFRKRRPSVTHPVLPMNAIRQMSVDSGMADLTLLSEPRPSNSAMLVTIEEAAASASATQTSYSKSSLRRTRINSDVGCTSASTVSCSQSTVSSCIEEALPPMMLGLENATSQTWEWNGSADQPSSSSQYFCCYYSTDLDVASMNIDGIFLAAPSEDRLFNESPTISEEESTTIHIELGHVHLCNNDDEREDEHHDAEEEGEEEKSMTIQDRHEIVMMTSLPI